MTTDAYVPAHHLYSCIGEDFQRITNDLRDKGIDVDWTIRGPVSRNSGVSLSFCYMYPTIIQACPDVLPLDET